MTWPELWKELHFEFEFWNDEDNEHYYCTESEFRSVSDRHIRELLGFLKQRGMWMQKDKTISIEYALCNILQRRTEWPKDAPFDSPAMPSSDTPAMDSSSASATSLSNQQLAFPTKAESPMQQPLRQPIDQPLDQPLD